MKFTYRQMMSGVLVVLMPAGLWPAEAIADAWTESGLFDSADVRDTLSMRHKPIYFDQYDLKQMESATPDTSEVPEGGWILLRYLKNRRALTGGTCAINKMISTAKVGGWTDALGNLTNDDLDDYIEINGVAAVSATVDPIISVRDRSCYYARGTTAGFCMVAGSGNDVLSLDVVKAVAIGFYREGELIGVVGTTEGQSAGLLNLQLVQIPNSGAACICVSAEAPGVFDEISLDFPGGVNIGVGQNLRIKYAFVGKAAEYTITEFDYHNNQYGILPTTTDDQRGHEPVYHEMHPEQIDVVLKDITGYNPVLLGIPFPMVSSEIARFTDSDLTNAIVSTPLLGVAYRGGVKYQLRHSEELGKEVFAPGTEIGFVYQSGSLLELGVGTWVEIVLYDVNGNKVHTETIKGGVLGLGLAGGGRETASIVAEVPFSGAELRLMGALDVDLGGISMYYSFVREKPEVRHQCPINPSVGSNVCPDQTTFQLRSNPQVSVTWSIEHAPAGSPVEVSESGYVSGMDPTAEEAAQDWTYIFLATAADGCTDRVMLVHSEDDDAHIYASKCGIALTNNLEEPEAPKYAVITEKDYPGITGGLLHFDDLRNPENVLTADLKDYATYVGGLELATNTPVIGIHRTDGGQIVDYSKPGETPKRLGFMVASAVEGLNLGALEFWQVGCYYKGREVCRKVIDESNVVSADVGGANASQKVRYSIAVPEEMAGDLDPDNEDGLPMVATKIDAIILWSSGVLSLGGGQLYIYYPFIEEANAGCNDPMGCEPTYVSWDDSRATLDFDMMQQGSAIVVANAVNDLDNFVDNDMDSYMSIANSVTVGDGIPVAVKLGKTADYRHQLGIVMDNKTFLAGINAGSWMTVELYYQGQPTGDKFTDWNAVDANVIGYGDKNVVIVQPKYMYDEVKLTIAKIAGVLDVMKFYGMFLRPDIDNDGLPDCQDTESCSDGVRLMAADKVCVGDPIEFMAAGKDMETGYWVRFSEPGLPADVELQYITPGRDGFLHAGYETRRPGAYQVIFYENVKQATGEKDEDGNLKLDAEGNPLTKDVPGKTLSAEAYWVYPEATTWKTTATNSDWTKWDNWSDGTPYCCTRVTIPSGARYYPDLTGKVEQGDEYCCEGIFFETEGKIGRVHKLNYEKAWVELEVEANRYHLLSAPLRGMVTGDMFIPAEMKGCHDGERFTAINAGNAPENRFNPTVYQRMWNAGVLEQGWNGAGAQLLPGLVEVKALATARWSKNFNHVATEYGLGQGFSMWVDNGELPEDAPLTFRFPKEHTQYSYFNDFDPDEATGLKEDISRIRENAAGEKKDVSGRFIYETDATPMIFAPTLSDESQARSYRREVYQAALPLEITLENLETSDCYLLGNPFMSAVSVERMLEENKDAIKGVMRYDGNAMTTVMLTETGTVGTSDAGYIAPLESVLVLAREEGKSITLTLTEAMISGPEEKAAEATGTEEEGPAQMRVRISGAGRKAGLCVAETENIVANQAVFDREVAPQLAIFAIERGVPCDIVAGSDAIALSIINRTGEAATLDFRALNGFERADYSLYDAEEQIRYDLDREITIPANVTASAGRYVLKRRVSISADDRLSQPIYAECRDGKVEIKSVGEEIAIAGVYDADGRLLQLTEPHSPEVTLQAPRGIFIVVAATADGKRHSFKLIGR